MPAPFVVLLGGLAELDDVWAEPVLVAGEIDADVREDPDALPEPVAQGDGDLEDDFPVSRCGVMWTLPPTISTLNPSGTGIRSSRSNHSSKRLVFSSAMSISILSSRTVIWRSSPAAPTDECSRAVQRYAR